jgi:multiple sugar transport system ATP-binding protein
MNAGNAEQIGTPQEIYTKPRTLFVADFIGSPSMNFLPSIMEGLAAKTSVGVLTLDAMDFTPSTSGSATLGIRPQNISLVRQNDSDLVLNGTVVFTEYLGNEVMMVVDCSGTEISIVVDAPSAVAEGIETTLYLAQEFLHVFDSESGLRLNND